MRTIFTSLVALLSWTAFAQSTLTSITPSTDGVQQAGLPGRGVYAITETGPHHRRWSKIDVVQGVDGLPKEVTSSYVELASGLNRRDDTGRWVPAQAHFELFKGGVVARDCAHKVVLANSPADDLPVDMLTSDGKRLSSRVLGISYYSPVTGASVMIAEVRPVQGKLIPPNQVIYEDAFDGGFRCDLRYTVSLAGLEQDLIIREQLPSPEAFNNIRDPDARLEVVTEFIEAPQPQIQTLTLRAEADPAKRAQMADPDFEDQMLRFGAMLMGHGSAFAVNATPGQPVARLRTAKRWQVVDGRSVLFEAVELQEAAAFLAQLPAAHNQASILKKRPVVASHRVLPKVKPTALGKPIIVAQADRKRPGFVLDYTAVHDTTNMVFAGDTTYYVTNAVSLTGTTVIEGGAVIKYDRDNYPSARVYLSASGPVVCRTSPYHPAVLTAKDDDTVGAPISGSSGTPTGTYPGFALLISYPGAPQTIQNINCRYAAVGVEIQYQATHLVKDCQFVMCGWPLASAYGPTNIYPSLAARNVLIDQVADEAVVMTDATVTAEHVTFRDINLIQYPINTTGLGLINCIVAGVSNSCSGYTYGSTLFTNSSAGLFQSVGAGRSYLADGSPYRDAGTTNVNAQLLSDLAMRTTFPPVLLTNDISGSVALLPQASRDWDTPDLGYHYFPIDYCMSGLNMTNGTILLTNGVVLAAYGTCGITLGNGAQILSQGRPQCPNRLIHYDVVQERPYTNWYSPPLSSPRTLSDFGHTRMPFSMRWTQFSCLAGNYSHWNLGMLEGGGLSMRDCEIYGGTWNNAYGSSPSWVSGMTNCLLDRVYSVFGAALYPQELYLRNCLFHGGTLTTLQLDANSIVGIYDTAFDGVTITTTTAVVSHGFNAYINTPQLPGSTSGNITLTNFTYQAGPCGLYYQGQTNFLNMGSRSATLTGLFHYTTTTDQVKETNSVVDIGYHYVALNGSGLPVDTDGDGISDVQEDLNGDGQLSSGETDWQNSADQGFRVFITEPKSNANLP